MNLELNELTHGSLIVWVTFKGEEIRSSCLIVLSINIKVCWLVLIGKLSILDSGKGRLNLLLSSVNDTHDMPACVVHHVFHDGGLDLLDSILHLAHTRQRQSLESSRFCIKVI